MIPCNALLSFILHYSETSPSAAMRGLLSVSGLRTFGLRYALGCL